MLKKSLLWLWRATFWLIVATLSVMLIAAITIQFWLMPNIGRYKNDIAQFASQAANQKITIGHLEADWDGIHPHLMLGDIRLFDAQDRIALEFKKIDVLVSWLSVPLLQPYLAQLSIHSPDLIIRRLTTGEIFIAGISINGASKPDLANWILKQNSVEVDHARIQWLDEQRNAPALNLHDVNLNLESPLWRGLVQNHEFSATAIPSAGTREVITIHGDFYGNDIGKIDEWDGYFSIQLKNTDLAAFKPWVDYPVDIQSGVGAATARIYFANHMLQSVNSDFNIQNLQLLPKSLQTPLRLRKLSGKLEWKNLTPFKLLSNETSDQGYRVRLNQLFAQTDSQFALNNFNVEYSETKNGVQEAKLTLASANITGMAEFASLLPWSESTRQQVINAAPEGKLEQFTARWAASNGTTTHYEIQSKFSGLGIQAQDKLPGFNNLAGNIKADQKNGLLTLRSQQASLDFKGLLRWPIPISTLNGDVRWQRKDPVTEITIKDLNINNAHLGGNVNANYIIDPVKGDYLDLKAKFDRGDAKHALFYYPITLGTPTLHWLDTSILSGNANDIHVEIKGRLADFPFVTPQNQLDPAKGIFRVTAKLSDILLEYGTGWPVVNQLGMNLLFEGKRMELTSTTGKIFGNHIVKSKTVIPQLDADSPMLYIDAEVTGPVSEGIHFVNKSPVLEVTQGFTEGLITSGNGKLNLSLKIPMQDLEASKYKGTYQIVNGRMESPEIPTLAQINGNLEFTESSLVAKNIKANAFASPLVFNLASGKDKSIRIGAAGKISDDGLKQLLRDQNLPKLSAYVNGNADWSGNILIQKPRVSINLRSDLVGINSRFPAPLNKSIGQPLSLRIYKRQDAGAENLYVNLGNKVVTKISRSIENGKPKMLGADIQFYPENMGSSTSTEYERMRDRNASGISVGGKLDYLDADAWRYVIKNIKDSGKQTTAPTIKKIALSIDALDLFNRRINQLKINHLAVKDGLEATIESREISGDLQWIQQNNGKLIARLSKFIVPESAPDRLSAIKEQGENNAANNEFTKQRQDYPAIDIFAENFEFDQKNFGSLEVLAYPQQENWNIQRLKIASPDGVISADGAWNNWIRNPNTALNVNWDIKDLGKTLKRFGYPDTVKDGSGEFKGKLSWPGSPSQFETVRLNGELEFDVRKGQILQVQPGVGRLLGLISLQSLPRRLTLDFRDLFSSGFAFDKITASVKINQGILRSDNFTMTGPAADVQIKGETNLQKETQHLYVKVLPRISDSVSLAALAGGPLAGAVAFLAQKVLKDPLNKIASTEYEIVGTWDNPQEIKTAEPNGNKSQGSSLISR